MIDDDFDGKDMPPEHEDLIEDLMRVSASWLLADPDPQRFINRLALEGPQRFAALFDGQPGQRRVSASKVAIQQAQFFRSFGWAIASAMPLPSQGFAARKLPLPGRNDPCICGSLRKFKHCCATLFEQLPAFEPEGLGAVMLTEMPRAQWAGLPGARVPPRMVFEAAAMLNDEGEERAACALLEPWAKLPAPWPAAHAALLDLLCDVYLDMDEPRKREKLARAMVELGDVQVQSAGWRRLSMMAADTGDAAASREAFERAQRLTPDDPDVAVLEVTNLLGAGERGRAAERATFHARRLARLPHAASLAGEIDVLERLGRGEFPSPPGFDIGDDDDDDDIDDDVPDGGTDLLDPESPFSQLARWAQALPPPKLRLRLDGATAEDLGALAPAGALAAPLARWRKAFRLVAPTAAWESLGPEALEVFVDEQWSDLLQREPQLVDSFEVLDGLMLVLDLLPMGLAAGLQAQLLQRALDLWTLLLARFPLARCDWAHRANRPALRLLVRRVGLDTEPRADESMPWLRALVEVLNPHDNHGFRERLAAVYLRRGDAAATLALCERNPDDFVGMQLLRARALLSLQRPAEAAAVLKQALAANQHVATALTARRAPKLPQVPSYAIGSLEEAKLAIHGQHDLWRDAAVQKWLREKLNMGKERSLFDEPRT